MLLEWTSRVLVVFNRKFGVPWKIQTGNGFVHTQVCTYFCSRDSLLTIWSNSVRLVINRICAMVVDMRPAAGAAVTLGDFFGAQSVRDRHLSFLARSRFESVDRSIFDIFSSVFPVNRKVRYHHICLGSNTWLTQRLNLTPVTSGTVVRISVDLIRCQLGGEWLMVQCLVKVLFLF